MVAGRLGAAMAAELGTMRVTEQIDALTTLSTDPMKYLVVPRVLAATLALGLGIPLHHLQDSLGHTDPRTTRRYDHTRHRLEHSSAYRVGALFE